MKTWKFKKSDHKKIDRKFKKHLALKEVECIDQTIKLSLPTNTNEATIQGLLFIELKKVFDNVFLEFRKDIKFPYCTVECRFDIAIEKEGKWVIIEVKKDGRQISDRQVLKYSSFDAKIITCYGEKEIEKCLKDVDIFFNFPLLA